MISMIRYLKYLFRHKYFVFIECWRRGLYWRAFLHDLSKFLPDELLPYARFFYGKDSTQESRESRYQKINKDPRYFQRAWQLHLMRNDHHWQNWINIQDEGTTVVLEMPINCRLEMFCDWVGAGRAQGYYDPMNPLKEVCIWYVRNRNKIILHPKTRMLIENQ